ncbi:unnamed protein product [Amoebophrya sp. A120]|nr:unnamed protein product [Amoebophrya sp. A120]|eukprot:GSA120T00025092001.1
MSSHLSNTFYSHVVPENYVMQPSSGADDDAFLGSYQDADFVSEEEQEDFHFSHDAFAATAPACSDKVVVAQQEDGSRVGMKNKSSCCPVWAIALIVLLGLGAIAGATVGIVYACRQNDNNGGGNTALGTNNVLLAEKVLQDPDTAVIVVDFQYDFLEGGALAVPGADQKYEEAVRAFVGKARSMNRKIVWSQDWHPADHMSFAANNPGKKEFEEVKLIRTATNGNTVETNQVMWPVHCVQGSHGAEIAMPVDAGEKIQQKGTRTDWDSYSAFLDDGGHGTGLTEYLQSEGIKSVVVFGLALDYCVFFTATDGVDEGFNVYWVPELSRGINPDFDHAEYADAGCKAVQLSADL